VKHDYGYLRKRAVTTELRMISTLTALRFYEPSLPLTPSAMGVSDHRNFFPLPITHQGQPILNEAHDWT